MAVSSTLQDLRSSAGLSQRQLSELAGVASSSISRIEAGTMSPTVEVIDRLWDALGCTSEVRRAVDSKALAASRLMLGDTSMSGMQTGKWIERFEQLGDKEIPARLLWRASRFARLIDRPASTGWVADATKAFARARTFEDKWAWTGSVAARSYDSTRDTIPAWLAVYASEPDEFLIALDAVSVRQSPSATPIAVFSGDEVTFGGRWQTAEGDWCVAPLQAAIDCYGGTGRMPEDADLLLERLGLTDGE
ncbi:MAG: helix-turn-helix transcriptional regulator [Acidimicrobiales bacterium]|nr:helix-turn-helix transcriptional regulator [Acidimicrobiales bacterium]